MLPEKYNGFLFHYYRAEVYRETVWRNRLDVTTNWSIVVTGAIVSFVFSNAAISHAAILVNYLIIWFFVYIEARRFRRYSMLRERTRLFERHLLAPLFTKAPFSQKNTDMMARLGKNLENPQMNTTKVEAIAWRLRRNYFFIMPLLFFVWLAKINAYNAWLAGTPFIVLRNARLWFIPGEILFFFFFSSVLLGLCLALWAPYSQHTKLSASVSSQE